MYTKNFNRGIPWYLQGIGSKTLKYIKIFRVPCKIFKSLTENGIVRCPPISIGSISMDSMNPGSGSESVDTGQLYILMKETEEDTDK